MLSEGYAGTFGASRGGMPELLGAHRGGMPEGLWAQGGYAGTFVRSGGVCRNFCGLRGGYAGTFVG